MDAIRFGRWISERRRAAGWRSQRAFVETVQQDRFLSKYSISEDFLARLEAGRLARPFRKSIRQRVLALAGLLCKTPRELRAYLQAAELSDLSADETDYVNRLNAQLAARRTSTILFLPPRPPRLVGRAAHVHELTQALRTLETGVCAVTGMPGVGKSALTAEAVHQVATNERERLHLFPDGIATFSGTGRRGVRGLIALLQDIIGVFSLAEPSTSKATDAALISSGVTRSSGDNRLVSLSTIHTNGTSSNGHEAMLDLLEVDLAGVIDHVRKVLAGKRVLLVLDDMDAQFPLRQACEALLGHGQKIGQEGGGSGQASRVVLITSRYIPAPALVSHLLHLEPLEPNAALELFITLIDHALSNDEHACAERICATVGYLPLAIEAAAGAVTVAGIPLVMLAEHVMVSPLDVLLDGEGEVRFRLAQALANFDPQMQQHFALLSTLGTQTFALESAAAVRMMRPEARVTEPDQVSAYSQYMPALALTHFNSRAYNGTTQSIVEVPFAQLARAAADLGQFVRHSLVEIVPGSSPASFPPASRSTHPNESRYRLHPLLYAHAMDRLEQLEPEVVHAAQHNVQSYALAYVEHYSRDMPHLEHEREFLLAVLARMWQQEQYPLVVRFLTGLWPLTGRLDNYEQGERLLQWGIRASQRIQDQYHLAFFLSRLGKLETHHGQLTSAKHTLEQSLAIAESLGRSKSLWGALGDLAHIAHILDDVGAARGFAETYVQRAQEADNPVSSSIARYIRGFYARLEGSLDKAHDDVCSSLSLLSALGPDIPFCKDPFSMPVRAELARIEGDYARSKGYTEAGVSLAQITEPPYIIADLLYDQACFAHQQGIMDDARSLALRVVDMAGQMGTPHLHARAVTLMRLIPG